MYVQDTMLSRRVDKIDEFITDCVIKPRPS